jgi:hypothetical protein
MTKLLTEVMRKIVELPDERQDDAAHVLLNMIENDVPRYRLTDAQLRDVEVAITDVDAGNLHKGVEADRGFGSPPRQVRLASF